MWYTQLYASGIFLFLFLWMTLPGCLFAVVIECFMIGVNVWWVYLAPQNITRAISVLTLGNKVILYCKPTVSVDVKQHSTNEKDGRAIVERFLFPASLSPARGLQLARMSVCSSSPSLLTLWNFINQLLIRTYICLWYCRVYLCL